MDELDISFGKHKADTNWKPEYLSWEEFVERLQKVRKTKETMEQYDRMTVPQRGRVKDGPAFVGGLVRGGRRKKENVDTRSLITLDADFADADFAWNVDMMLGGTAYVIYTTHSHRPGRPKYRLIVPADRAMSPDEYTAVSRKLAEQIGMTLFDKTTFQVHRLMYLPSCSKDAKVEFEIAEGDPLCVDELLTQYEDWRDPLQWPRHKDDIAQRHTSKKMEDPRSKRGVVGTFCRCYSISEAISAFLPDLYEPTDDSLTRYTFAGSTSFGGLVIYDDDTFAYSHHESDPCSGREVNAFDLVRIHKFGRLDEDVMGQDVTKLPSYVAMRHYAERLDKVKELRQLEVSAELHEEFAEESFEDDSETEDSDGEISPSTKGAPIDLSGIKIPFGFKSIEGKLFEVKETKNDIKHIPVCDSLIAVTGKHINLTDGTEGLDVTWKTGKVVKTISNTRSTFMDNKKIINLADYGLPVHSSNARSLTSYLSRFESENKDSLKTELVSNQLGWVKGGFLLGERIIGDQSVQFLPKDAGDGQTVKGFHAKGSIKRTFEILEKIKDFLPVKLAVWAALAAPLLHLLGESPFIFELAGGTSKGKTTALRVAASLYGCPDEQKPGFFKQWNMTKVYVERYASTMNHLPLFIDDTKKADPRMIPPTIYQFCSGQGRGRGSLKGSQIGATWCTVLLSTGEQKLASYSRDGGAVGRILSLHGSPFERTDLETNELVESINQTVSENYGHVAEPWIRHLMSIDRKAYKRKITDAAGTYRQIALSHGEVAMRLSRIMAVLDVTGQMFDESFSSSLYDRDAIEKEWIKILTGATEMDRPLEALEDVMSWVTAHHRQFIRGDDLEHYGPLLSGRIKEDEVIILSEQLDTYLQSRGYEPNAMAKAWKDHGWLNTEENRTKKKIRIAGGLTRGYSFNLKAIGYEYDLTKDYSEFIEDESASGNSSHDVPKISGT